MPLSNLDLRTSKCVGWPSSGVFIEYYVANEPLTLRLKIIGKDWVAFASKTFSINNVQQTIGSIHYTRPY